MSNRVFKKVFGGGDELGGVSPTSEDEGPVPIFTKNKKTLLNPYQLLNDDLSAESEGKEGDDDDAGAAAGAEEESSNKQEDDTSQATTKKKRKKKRSGKKKNDKGAGGGGSSLDTELENEEGQKQQKTSSRPARKSESETTSVSSGSGGAAKAAFEELFKIDSKFLNSEFELKRIFGAKVINYERSKTGQRRIYRHSKLVMPKEQWPTVSGSGISMSYLNSVDGYMYFKFDHNLHYQSVQKQFMQAVDTLNPDNIVNILRVHPYHVDSHIQLSDMAKSAEDMSVAADLIEGAIHCMENAFHVRFCLTNPCCRLEYKFQENRAFFIVLFKHLVLVGQRACHRTALELCKRLLCLEPVSDPLCASLMIDFYALKCGEWKWLVDLYRFWEKPKNLDQLPNFSYSIALAHHLLSLKTDDPCEAEDNSQKADTLIQYAVLMFPSVLLPLLEKLGIQIDQRAKHHNYLNSFAQSSQSRSLRLLCDLYVWRTHHVWKEPSVLGWLEKNVTIILDRVDSSDPVVKDYESKRKRRYLATTPRNILRHVLLTDNKDLTFNFPPELTKEPILNYDPLPPPDTIDIYNIKEFQTRTNRGTGRGGILNMLLDSLWNDLNAIQPNDRQQPLAEAQPQPIREADGENPPIALGAGLQQSVTALLDAMRDLLTNANGRPEGDAADGEDSATDVEARDD